MRLLPAPSYCCGWVAAPCQPRPWVLPVLPSALASAFGRIVAPSWATRAVRHHQPFYATGSRRWCPFLALPASPSRGSRVVEIMRH